MGRPRIGLLAEGRCLDDGVQLVDDLLRRSREEPRIDDDEMAVHVEDPQLVDLSGALGIAARILAARAPAAEQPVVARGEVRVIRHVEGDRLPGIPIQADVDRRRGIARSLGRQRGHELINGGGRRVRAFAGA